MAYSAITNAEIDQDSPITQTLMTKYRDNVIHNAEGIWHPYNRVEPSGTQTGVFYDFAIDGAVASVETPDFAAGYDYQIAYEAISTSSESSSGVRIELYRDTSASYAAAVSISGGVLSSSQTHYGSLILPGPATWARPGFVAREQVNWRSTPTADTTENAAFELVAVSSTVQTYGKARISFTVGNIDAGKIALLRRKMIWGL